MSKIAIIFTLGVGLFAACSSDNDVSISNEQVPLEIAAGISMQVDASTRAVETAWETGDEIGVFLTTHNSNTIYTDGSGSKGFNRQYVFNDGTNYETWGNTFRLFTAMAKKVYLPSYGIDILGVYPFRSSSNLIYSPDGESESPTILPKVPVNVQNQTSQKAIDLMRARAGNVSNSSFVIELLFYHRLTKLVFNLKQGEGLLPDELKDATYLGIEINNQYTSATYDIYNDAFTITSGEYESITPTRSSSAPTGYARTFEAIVLPTFLGNPATDRTVTITFYRKSEDQIINKFIIPERVYFEPGHKYTFNITVNATSIKVNTVNEYAEQW